MDDPDACNIWPRTKTKMKMFQEEQKMEQVTPLYEVEIETEVEKAEIPYEIEEIIIHGEQATTLHDYAKIAADDDIDFQRTQEENTINENNEFSPCELLQVVDTGGNDGSASLANVDGNNGPLDTSIGNETEKCNTDGNNGPLEEANRSIGNELEDATSVGTNINDVVTNGESETSTHNGVDKKEEKIDYFHFLVTSAVIDGEVTFACKELDIPLLDDAEINVDDIIENSQRLLVQNKTTIQDAIMSASSGENDTQITHLESNAYMEDNSENDVTLHSSIIDELPSNNGDFLGGETNSDMVSNGSETMKLITLNGWQLYVHEESQKYGSDFGSACKTMKSLWSEMGEHERKSYNIRGKIGILLEPCEKCGRTFSTFYKRNEHIMGCGPTECVTCKKVFADARKMKQHAMKHTQKYLCHTCHSCWESASKLKRHMEKHEKKKPIKCNVCGKGFARKDNLKIHFASQHSNS